MEVTRQLLTERAGKTGLCRIQLTFCWDGQRLPRDWDAQRKQCKAQHLPLQQQIYEAASRGGLPLPATSGPQCLFPILPSSI
ncbi:hypothetical protein Q5H93_14920 [Hymenobacter sp. ASUV-10]|uniref:Arm DNA-binding domain-containing protein n=1 Tax=Hymenobacter aranciens TaxID=3063996 RepID=A0ABT9BCN4_9BACT|nr:hypothetical protein [Hymenobacter sp. ASUV-10]MDO7876034.1 hypothetical protein [Hymenobacter sp. ASUV-10]